MKNSLAYLVNIWGILINTCLTKPILKLGKLEADVSNLILSSNF